MDLRNERARGRRGKEGGAREKEKRRDSQSRTHQTEPETRGANKQIIRTQSIICPMCLDSFRVVEAKPEREFMNPCRAGGPWLLQPRGMH